MSGFLLSGSPLALRLAEFARALRPDEEQRNDHQRHANVGHDRQARVGEVRQTERADQRINRMAATMLRLLSVFSAGMNLSADW